MANTMTTNMHVLRALRLLSSMYLCKPAKESIEGWRSLLGDDAFVEMDGLKTALNGIDTAAVETMENLLWEYTRLFIGPYKLPCPPWESVYTSPKKLMMQAAVDEVRELYGQAGLTIDRADVMPDHIGVELNFLAVLLQKSHEEKDGKVEYLGITEKFLNDHLLKWAPDFTRDMEHAAETPFYQALARATRKLVDLIGG